MLCILKGAKIDTRGSWECVVKLVALTFEQAAIRYHVDASSSLYVQGVEFEMEDLDLTVEWGTLQNARKLFLEYTPSEISSDYPPSFRFIVKSKEVHVMSYQSETGIGSSQDRIKVKVAGSEIWRKTIEFYKQNMASEHKLWKPLRVFFEKSSS